MKNFLVVFFVVIIANITFSAKSIDLPKHYKFPKNYFEGKYYDSVKGFFLIATEKIKDSRLIFTGYVKDKDLLAELYHNCYVYIHGHEFGGTNPTMIKAMAYGCAILALDTVFNHEMLQKGKFGLFFKKELMSVTNQINYCEKEKLIINKFRQNSINGITQKYSWDYVTNQYLDVFNSLVSQRN